MNQKQFDDFVERLNTQDARATSYPIYIVKERVRFYGIDMDYHHPVGHVWVCLETADVFEPKDKLDMLSHSGIPDQDANTVDFSDEEITINGYTFEKRYYMIRERTVNVHFTEKAADDFIRNNRHNLKDPFVYVDSQYRCHEWNDIVEMLKNGQLILKEGAMMDGIRDTLSSMESRLNDKIDSAKLSVLRGMHSGDKVAKALTALVDKALELRHECTWKCSMCGAELISDDPYNRPICVVCSIDMDMDRLHLFDTEEWKAADAMVLRIKEIKASKEERKKK